MSTERRLYSPAHALLLSVLACRPAAPPPEQTCCADEISRARALAVAEAEALRLWRAKTGRPASLEPLDASRLERAGCAWKIVVGFQNPTDTLAEIEIDACTSAVRASHLGGGL